MAEFTDLTGRTILQVTPELSAGGVERTVLEMTEAIKAAGGRALLASAGGRMEDEFAALGGEFIRMGVDTKNPIALKSNAARLEKLIEQESIDIVHARSRAPAWSAYWATQKTGTPFVTTYHGAYSGKSRLKVWYNSVMARGDIVIANSAWIAEHVAEVHDVPLNKLVTIPRGVDLAAFDPDTIEDFRISAIREQWDLSPEDNRIVLFLPGRFTEWKGQRVAIDAIAELSKAEADELVLILAGDPQERLSYVAELDDLISHKGLTATIKICPHITDMPAAYMAADIVLAPSVRPEAFGRTAAEASAMKRPVIVTDHGGGRETVIEGLTGARVTPGDANALAASIRALVAVGSTARDGMGEDGRKHIAAHFSKSGLQSATLDVYMRVLGNGH